MLRTKTPEPIYTVTWVDDRRVKIVYAKGGREFTMPADRAARHGYRIPGLEVVPNTRGDAVGWQPGMAASKGKGNAH